MLDSLFGGLNFKTEYRMAPSRKTKKTKGSPRSVMGQLMPPVDVRSEDMLGELSKRIAAGPLTLVLVYADWCGHCQTFKPMMEKLENLSGSTVQKARLSSEQLPNSSLSSVKIEGYPTLLLVDKNGNALKFKSDSGEITNAIPDHTNMTKMETLVRNAGTPQGLSLLRNNRTANSVLSMSPPGSTNVSEVAPNEPLFNTPKNILADRLSSKTVRGQNSALLNSGSSSLREATAPDASVVSVASVAPIATSTGKRLQGGGGGDLWSTLVMASQQIAPAAALFLGAAYVTKGKRSTTSHKRKTRRVKRARA
jgi:thiol-disulfide isomerase/thioredoxin